MASAVEHLTMRLSDYVTLATELQTCCSKMSSIKGMPKLERRIGTEIKFFHTLGEEDVETQTASLQSSNLGHFAAILHAASSLPDVVAVIQPYNSPGRKHSLVVDVVAEQGRSWVKVVARKGQALHQVWAGRGQFGERDMVHQLREYTQCAQHNPINFQPPHVHATFYNTVTSPMADVLRQEGIGVWGDVVPVNPEVQRMVLAVQDDTDDDDDYDDDEYSFGSGDELGDDGNDDSTVRTDRRSKQDIVFDSEEVEDESVSSYVGAEHPEKLLNRSYADLLKQGDKLLPYSNVQTQKDGEAHRDYSGAVDLSFNRPQNEISDETEVHSSSRPETVSPTSREVDDEDRIATALTSSCTLESHDLETDSEMTERVSSSSSSFTKVTASLQSEALEQSLHDPALSLRLHVKRHASSITDETNETGKLRRTGDTAQRHMTSPFDYGISSFNESPRTSSNSWRASAWSLSVLPRSLQCLSKILFCYPHYPASLSASLGHQSQRGISGGGDDSSVRVKVNLDITTLITLVSSVCQGGCYLRFQDKVLDQQAAEEREKPSLPDLQQYLQGKELIVCRTAWSDFENIVQLLGGPTERKRAEQLLNKVTIVDDQLSERSARLKPKGKIKDRSKAVFGTGDFLQAVTVTANSGFVRAAFSQGVTFAVHMHPARALTEQKESSATPL